jgi:methionyl-tRNA formyltransferase
VDNLIRGAWPWPGAYADFVHEDRPPVRVILARARAVLSAEPEELQPGIVAPDLTVVCSGGRIEIVELKVAGKRLMGWKDFVNGYRVSAGDRFVQAEH